ncbi:MAG: hypothetical protein ACYDCK_10130 [Thermoplasmatota archaeon]
MATNLTVRATVRDRLKTFGKAGMGYDEILTRLMDNMEREKFVVAELKRARNPRGWVDLDDVE